LHRKQDTIDIKHEEENTLNTNLIILVFTKVLIF